MTQLESVAAEQLASTEIVEFRKWYLEGGGNDDDLRSTLLYAVTLWKESKETP